MQSIGFLGPAFFLTQLSHIHSPAMAVLCMACSQVCKYATNTFNFLSVSNQENLCSEVMTVLTATDS